MDSFTKALFVFLTFFFFSGIATAQTVSFPLSSGYYCQDGQIYLYGKKKNFKKRKETFLKAIDVSQGFLNLELSKKPRRPKVITSLKNGIKLLKDTLSELTDCNKKNYSKLLFNVAGGMYRGSYSTYPTTLIPFPYLSGEFQIELTQGKKQTSAGIRFDDQFAATVGQNIFNLYFKTAELNFSGHQIFAHPDYPGGILVTIHDPLNIQFTMYYIPPNSMTMDLTFQFAPDYGSVYGTMSAYYGELLVGGGALYLSRSFDEE